MSAYRFLLLTLSIVAFSTAFTAQNIQSVGSRRAFTSSTLQAATKKATAAQPENFKKGEFVSSIAEKTGMTKTDSEKALNAVIETIMEEVAAGKKINLTGFGTFKLSHRNARKGRNPQTGEQIDIKASNSPSFTASKAFKEAVNPGR
eukprot:CAMPEP_0178967916 /NCGR_PEP_ID=MMETSP0789-20121207/17907_1 /TAXON_ID=3005 /ORGANISM="Rhizosolenia setigera, Strain CCMP 1694" /LENGTH=146 /DNA_ID=CAMNT_0020653673 /DNA_START=72 /DNA_END=512 /DNA_ORIENTATION=+